MRIFHFFLLPIVLLTSLSCSQYHLRKNVYSLPDFDHELMSDDENTTKVILTAVNDFNAQLMGVESLGIQIGGINLLEQYVGILRNKYDKKMLLLNTGHFLPPTATGENAQGIFQRLGGLHFDAYGTSQREFNAIVTKQLSISNASLINSNIYSIRTGELHLEKPFVNNQIIEKQGIKFGLISIAPHLRESTLAGFYFDDAVASVLKARTYLKRNQADLIILISHFPTGCERNEEKDQLECESQGHINQLIERLPPKSLDIILTTSQYHAYGQWRDLIVVNSPGNGLYLNNLVIAFDKKTKKLDLNKTTLLPPTLLCSAFFQMSNDCYIGDQKRLERLQEDKLRTIPARFLNEEISINK